MNELVQKRLREWRSGAIHNLYELEKLAQQVRGRLEADPEHPLSDEADWISDLGSELMGVITFLDRTIGMEQAGLK